MNVFPTFDHRIGADFRKELNRRVDEFLRHRGRHATLSLHFKAVVLFAAYLAPLGLLLFLPMPVWVQMGLWTVMGLAMAGIGMNVMHDANHGSWSNNPRINRLYGASIYLLAGLPLNWKIQHNYLHHQFTNLHGLDEDVEVNGVLRLHTSEKRRWFHRFQHVYAPALYSLLTLNWALLKDFNKLLKYRKLGLLKKFKAHTGIEMAKLVLAKLFYFSLFVVLPIVFSPQSAGSLILGFVVMHLVAGLVLSIVFQLAHILEEVDMPHWEGNSELDNEWMIHQLQTTANFSEGHPLITWYTGGLNHQIEHHLFPNVSHAHYPAIAPLVRQTAEEFGLPYRSVPRFRGALANHFRTLWVLGNEAA